VGGKVPPEIRGKMSVQVLVQPRARVVVPLIFFCGDMLPGATCERAITLRVRRECRGGGGRETFEGAVVVEEKVLVCGSVLAPKAHEHVRLFVRDFTARFGSGAAFSLRQVCAGYRPVTYICICVYIL